MDEWVSHETSQISGVSKRDVCKKKKEKKKKGKMKERSSSSAAVM